MRTVMRHREKPSRGKVCRLPITCKPVEMALKSRYHASWHASCDLLLAEDACGARTRHDAHAERRAGALVHGALATSSSKEETMRLISSLISTVVLVAVTVGLVAFSIENGEPQPFRIFGFAFHHIAFWVPVVVGVAVGIVLAVIVLMPGRVRRMWQNYRLRGRAGRLEADLASLQQRRIELEREIERLSGIASRQAASSTTDTYPLDSTQAPS